MQIDKSTILIQAEYSNETANSIATWTTPVESGEQVYRLDRCGSLRSWSLLLGLRQHYD